MRSQKQPLHTTHSPTIPHTHTLCLFVPHCRVKFGAFFEYLQTEHAGSFDRIASGHYARVTRLLPQDSTVSADSSSSHSSDSSSSHDESTLLERQASNSQASSSSSVSPAASLPPAAASAAQLMLVPDAVKDQTYFLANLSPAQLARCMFPLGSFTKPQVGLGATIAVIGGSLWCSWRVYVVGRLQGTRAAFTATFFSACTSL